MDLLILQHVDSKGGTTVEASLQDPTAEKATLVARQVMEFITANPRLGAAASEDPVPNLVRRVVVDDQIHRGLRQAWEEGENGSGDPGRLAARDPQQPARARDRGQARQG